MATAYKHSGVQGSAAVGTYVTLYTVPSSTEGIISSITICNTAAAAATFRIGIDAIAANDTIALTLGIALAASKVIRVSSSANTLTFIAFVSEIS